MNLTTATYSEMRDEIVGFLKEKSQFKDMNFAGSTIGALVDALAYLGFNLQYYANFSIREAFLDSAQVRANVVSHAKALGYFPYQYKAAKAKIRVTFVNEGDGSVSEYTEIPAETSFNGVTESGQTYNFITTEATNFKSDDGGVTWYADLDLIQGTWIKDQFSQDVNSTTRCILQNPCDTSTLEVLIKSQSFNEDDKVCTNIQNVSEFSPEALLYYLQETDGNVEVYFGDDVMSRGWYPSEVVTIRYLTTVGSEGNNIATFSMNETIADLGSNRFTITTLEASHNGSDQESIESIKFNAPKYYQRQDRNVTVDDYTVDIMSKFGGLIKSMNVWGGEDNDPPSYGYIYVSILPKSGNKISAQSKAQIVEALEAKNLPCIVTKIVDPVSVGISLTLDVNWYSSRTTYISKELTDLIRNEVVSNFSNVFSGFRGYFQDAKMIKNIMAIDSCIDDVTISKSLMQTINAYGNKKMSYSVYFQNPIEPGSVLIGPWTRTRNLAPDEYSIFDSNGYLYGMSGNTPSSTSIGTVDYEKGTIIINNFDFLIAQNQTVQVKCVPDASTLSFKREYILELLETNTVPNVTIKLHNLSSVSY